MTKEEIAAELADIIADAAPLPLLDAAYALWRLRYRLATLEGHSHLHDRKHAQDGPAFNHLKRAHPRADDSAIRQAIITAVKFEDACFRYFEETTAEYWQRCVHAVALARKEYPGLLESTYQQAANDLAYYYK